MSINRQIRSEIFGLFTLILIFILPLSAFARTSLKIPLRDDWTQTFYTEDNSQYLTLYPDGFKQLIRVGSDSCKQLTNISVVLLKETLIKNSKAQSTFKPLLESSAPKIYGLNRSDYCWYEVELRGLASINGLKYVLKFEDNVSSGPTFYKGITSSLLPYNRLTQNSQIDSWIDLGAFGATPVVGGGVYFKIWEPLSNEVHLFINDRPAIKLNSDFELNDERRFHYAYVPDAKLRDKYHFQFLKNGQYENLEVANFNTFSPIKIDPMARELTYDAKGGRYNGYINPRAIISQDNQYTWNHDSKISTLEALDYNNWIIYQLWPLTFNPKEIDGAYVQGKFLDIIPKIPYLSDLGINAVELLPVHENRFNASWGYALDSLIILENTLGTKSDMKKLVDELHAKKIKVIFDVVINHVNNNLLREPISEKSNISKFYGGDTPWGPKPRFESVWVRKWITDSLIHLIHEYHLDGFRFDMTDSIFNGTKGGYRFLQELNYLIKVNSPTFYNSAEQLPDDVWVTYPFQENGLGFDSQWNDRFKNFFELEFDQYAEKNRSIDLFFLGEAFKGNSDHQMSPGVWYSFGDPQRTVNYLGSHDFVGNKNPLIRIVSKYEAEEQEDANIFSRVNPLEESGDLKIPFRKIHNQFTHALTRLAYGLLFTKPGAVLFYQGEELASDLNIQNEWDYVAATKGNRFPSKNININKYVRSHRMPWYYYELSQGKKSPILNFVSPEEENLFKGHHLFFKEMINFKKTRPELNLKEAQNVKIDNYLKIVTFELQTKDEHFFIVGNFNVDNGGAWINFPGNSQKWWSEVMNSSLPNYGGDSETYQNIIPNIGGRRNLLRLKGPSFIMFREETTPEVGETLYFRSNIFAWKANQNLALKPMSTGSEWLVTNLSLTKNETLEYKLGTKNWEIDIGLGEKAQTMSYIPNSPNAKVSLPAGEYLFKFNIKTFAAAFEKTNKLIKNNQDIKLTARKE